MHEAHLRGLREWQPRPLPVSYLCGNVQGAEEPEAYLGVPTLGRCPFLGVLGMTGESGLWILGCRVDTHHGGSCPRVCHLRPRALTEAAASRPSWKGTERKECVLGCAHACAPCTRTCSELRRSEQEVDDRGLGGSGPGQQSQAPPGDTVRVRTLRPYLASAPSPSVRQDDFGPVAGSAGQCVAGGTKNWSRGQMTW